MSVTAKVQNLIDLINNSNGTEQEEKESIRYLESAPQPQPSTADIDASKIKIVVLGCGLVVPPLIEYLNFYGYQIIIATRTVSRADAVIARVTNPQLIRVEKLDFSNSPSASDALLDRLCNEGDVIISLLPYIYHVKAAQVALKYGKHFCTTSYISPEMEALRQQVEAKKLCFLNECGVDPGLDHMSAMKIIDEVHDNGGRIVSFTSICGGLPAPEFNDNPFGYKFSWAPKGVLLASRNSARQFIGGQIVDIPGVQLFAAKNVFKQRVKLIGDLEWYYNRDSCQYIDHYGIQEISTMIRGTYRYPGWCETLKAIADLKLTSDEEISTTNKSYRAYFAEYLKISKEETLAQGLSRILKLDANCTAIKNIEWLGLFREDGIDPNIAQTPIDVLCSICVEKLKYVKGEKDMLVLKHSFETEYPSDGWRETRQSLMLDFGLQPHDHSSMARTVSLPLAIAIRALTENRIKQTGVIRPVSKELYLPVLREMADLGVKFEETTLPPLLWIRDEVKPAEHRVPITPKNAARLLQAGYRVYVEKSKTRCFADTEYANIGCKMVASGSWINAPHSAFICGLKELPDEPAKLRHRHIYFAHCFKGQNEAVPLLKRFKAGKGEVLDLEYLVDEQGRRVAAFGRSAGMVGMAMGIIVWCHQVLGETFKREVQPWQNVQQMVNYCTQLLGRAIPKSKYKRAPKVIVIGALGRCGKGSVYIARQCKLQEISEWDLNETKAGGPFESIVTEHDIFVNCIALMNKIPPFITLDLCKSEKRRLTVISDVACDPNNPNNPVPVYDAITTVFKPVRTVIAAAGQGVLPLDVTAIDHLPSLIPLEASEHYSDDLVDTFLDLNNRASGVWLRARKVFLEHVAKV